MNRRSIFTLGTMAALGLALLQSDLNAQQRSLKEQLVGTWTIVSWEDIAPNGTKRQITNPNGFLIFDSGGRYAQVIARSDRPKFNSPGQPTAEELAAAVEDFFAANAGTWSVSEAENKHFRLRLSPDGNVQSIMALQSGQEIVNDKGELPFNELLRVEGQEPSAIASPFPPVIKIKRGVRMTRLTITRERSAFPLTTFTIYDDLDLVELHNEIDGARLPFAGGKSWHDSYYFAFPFAVGTQGLKVLRGGQKWFDRLPDDYLPGARRDSVTTQHLIGMSDGKASVMLAHRQAFHFVFPSYVKARPSEKGAPAEFPAMFTGKWPLREATLYSRAFRRGNQEDTHDLGVTNVMTVEPGLGQRYIFDYALNATTGKFDDVSAWRLGSEFNVPLRAIYVAVSPAASERSYFGVNQPNVEIVTVKQLADTTLHGEVSANPLDPRANHVFVIRLQEFAGRAATTEIMTPVSVRAAALLNLTEDRVQENVTTLSPLTVKLKPYETVTLRIEIEPAP